MANNEIPIPNPMAVDAAGMDRAYAAGPGPAARTLLSTLLGNQRPITEQDFGPAELKLLEKAVRKAEKEGRQYIGYGDYGEADPWAEGSGAVVNALTQLPASMAFTLGMAKFKRAPDGTVEITDQYDFGAPKAQADEAIAKRGGILGALAYGMENNGLLGVGNVIGNVVAPQGSGRPVKIRLVPPGLRAMLTGK
jgi:hypothetical protein